MPTRNSLPLKDGKKKMGKNGDKKGLAGNAEGKKGGRRQTKRRPNARENRKTAEECRNRQGWGGRVAAEKIGRKKKKEEISGIKKSISLKMGRGTLRYQGWVKEKKESERAR